MEKTNFQIHLFYLKGLKVNFNNAVEEACSTCFSNLIARKMAIQNCLTLLVVSQILLQLMSKDPLMRMANILFLILMINSLM